MNTATIITIGDELLIGQVMDTNASWLGRELTKIGFSIREKLTISDTEEAIVESVDQSIVQSDLVFITGGLGPTKDDITKKVLAKYFDAELIHCDEVLSDVEAFIKHRGSKMNALNEMQALVPDKAQVLRNSQGTAPGMWFDINNKVVISVPGVPSEMKGLFNKKAKDKLKEHFALQHVLYKTVLVTGIAEAHLAERLQVWEGALPEAISLAYLPSPGVVRLRIGLSGDDEIKMQALIDQYIEKLQPIIGDKIFGFDNDTLPEVIAKELIDRKASIATAESCTGGNIAHEFTLMAGSSRWYKGSVVAYDNDVKARILNVPQVLLDSYGAVSHEVVEAMVIGIRNVMKTDYAIATSGIAGPSGGSDEKPVGLVWVAIAGPDFVKTKQFNFGNDREINISLATYAVLNFLRQELQSLSIDC